ncbi:MAG: PspC domain-containing protein [Bacteroidales bacterium]
MKKILSINLNNTVFHIDEDAHEALNKYLEELNRYFADEPDGEEILHDVEARISELFSNRMKYGLQVITYPNVEEVIAQLGQPSDYGRVEDEGDDDGEYQDNQSKESGENPNKEHSNQRTSEPNKVRRIYRDKENALLGGVASGLSHYFNIDVVIIRVLMIVLLFFWGAMIPIYLILWIIMPPAESYAQKLEMHGIAPTVENISNFIKEGVERVSKEAQEIADSPYNKSLINKTQSGLTRFFRGLIRVIFAIIGGCFGCFGIIIIFPILVLLIALLSAPIELFTEMFPYSISNMLIHLSSAPYLLISALTVIGLPIIVLCYVVVQKAFKLAPIRQTLGWILFAIWMIGLIASIIWGVKTLPLLLSGSFIMQ